MMGQWLLVHWKDFEEEEHEAEHKLIKFLERYEKESDVQQRASRVRQYLDTARQFSNASLVGASDPLLPSIIPKNVPCPLRKVHPEEMARQISLMQWQVFSKLNLAHAIPFTGTSSTYSSANPSGTEQNTNGGATFSLPQLTLPIIQVRDEYVPQTSQQWAPFEDWNNLGGHIQRWAATCVCTVAKPISRAKMLQFLIEVAYFLYKLGNFDGAHRLIEGLKLLPLPQTWSALPVKVRAIHETLLNSIRLLFTDPARIANASHPHIPIIETFTNALVHIGQAIPRFVIKPTPLSAGNAGKWSEARSYDKLRENFGMDTLPTSGSAMLGSPTLEASSMPSSSTWSEGSLGGFSSNDSSNPLNCLRAHEEAVFLTKLKSYQSKPFPFQSVQWMADFISRISPLSVWTIQEYCETLEPPKYTSPTSSAAMRKHASSPRHISGRNVSSHTSPSFASSTNPSAQRSAGANSSPDSPPSSPRPESPESSPREYHIEFSPQNNSILSGWGTIDDPSPPVSPNSSPPKVSIPVSLGTGGSSSVAPSSSGSSLSSASSSLSTFNLRRPLNRNAMPAELELERLGFFVYSTPPSSPSELLDPIKSSSSSLQSNVPNWWILLDEDRLEEAEEDLLPALLLEYLPFPAWDTLFSLNPLKMAFLNLRSSKLTAKFKAAAKLRFRQDLCFAAASHSKGLKLNSYRLLNNEAVQYVPTLFSVVLTNASSALMDWEVSPSTPISSPPHITRDEIFVSFSPPSGTLSPGKSVTVKITAVLLEETQFYKIFRIRASWQDLQYSNFVPLMLALSCPATVPPGISAKEMSSIMNQLAAANGAEDAKRKSFFFARKPSSTTLDTTDPTIIPSSPSIITPFSFSTPSFLLTHKKEGFWKIPIEELKVLKRLGGTQAAVSLCNLYGADVVLKKWDMGTLDPIPDEFEAELAALRSLRHPNLIQFLGAQCSRGMAFLVTEYLPRGALSDVLRSGELRRRQKVATRSSSSQSAYIAPSLPSSSSSSQSSAYFFSNYGDVQSLAASTSGESSFSSSSPPNALSSLQRVRNPNASMTATRIKLGIAADVASAMAFMHYNRKLHRDLKSLNVLIDEGYRAKVGDLGSSKEWAAMLQMTTGVGSLDWIAPEVLSSRTYSFAADVFSFGLVLWELVHEKFPDRPMDMVGKGGIPAIDPEKLALFFRDSASPNALQFANLITTCCDPNPEMRPSFADIVIVLEQLLTNPLCADSSSSSSSSSAPLQRSLSSSTSSFSTSASNPTLSDANAAAYTDQIAAAKRTGSGDQWIRALKNSSASTSSSHFLQQQQQQQQNSPTSATSSPTSSSPMTPPQLTPLASRPSSPREAGGLNPLLLIGGGAGTSATGYSTNSGNSSSTTTFLSF